MELLKNKLPKAFKLPPLLSNMKEDTPILVGFSGGADSTALLHMLSLYAKESGAKIYAAHVNHCIRGEEADRDEAFCKNFANTLGVEFFSLRIDVPKAAKASGESIETAARNIRYQYFDSLMAEYNIPLLATAHNANDNLETVIFNISRGTGLSGLCGIPETRSCKNGIVIRPILGMEKREIISYCQNKGLDFVTDSTNTDVDYTRNKIRSEIIPILQDINSGAVKNAYRMTQSLSEDALYLKKSAEQFENENVESSSIELEKICSLPKALANRVIINLFDSISNGATLEGTHLDAIHTLVQRAIPHSSVSLPNNIEAVIENKKIHIKKKGENILCEPFFMPINEGSNIISQTNCEIFIGNSHITKNVYKKSTLMSFDFDKIKGTLIARNRLSGDKIYIGGMHKSLKKLMCDKKIPVEQRNLIPVLCDDNGIVAVPFIGVRDDVKCASKKDTKINLYFYLY